MVMILISLVEYSLKLMEKYAFMALIHHMESVESLEKSAGRAALNLGVDNDIRVGDLRGGRGGRYWVTRGGLSSNTERSVGYYGCKGHGQRAGVEGLVFLVTRVREGREVPLSTMVGNVW